MPQPGFDDDDETHTVKTLTLDEAVPPGFIKGAPVGSGDRWIFIKYDELPVGKVIQVARDAPLPSGWAEAAGTGRRAIRRES